MRPRLTGMVGAIGVVFMLTACAPTLFMKPGATPQDFEAESFQCKMQVMTAMGGFQNMDLSTAFLTRQQIRVCIESKGWREVSSQEIAARHQVETARIRQESAALTASQTESPEAVWRRKFEGQAREGKLNARSVVPPCTGTTPKDTPCYR